MTFKTLGRYVNKLGPEAVREALRLVEQGKLPTKEIARRVVKRSRKGGAK